MANRPTECLLTDTQRTMLSVLSVVDNGDTRPVEALPPGRPIPDQTLKVWILSAAEQGRLQS